MEANRIYSRTTFTKNMVRLYRSMDDTPRIITVVTCGRAPAIEPGKSVIRCCKQKVLCN